MAYALLIVEDPAQRATRTEAEGRELFARMQQFGESLAAEGKLVHVESLAGADTAVRVQRRAGATRLIDGPYAEAKEVVGGWAIMQYDSLEDAVADQREFAELHAKHWPEVTVVATLRQISDGPEPPTE